MDASRFIARKLRFQGRMATVSTAISFFVIIIAVAISGGFRHEIRDALAGLSGDVRLTGETMNLYGESAPVSTVPSYLEKMEAVEGVESITPAIYRAGIVKNGDIIHGVLFKGIPGDDSLSMEAVIPERLAGILKVGEGDRLLSYFIGEKIKARRFRVAKVEDSAIDDGDRLVVTVPIEDLRRLNGWEADQASALEVRLKDRFRARGVPTAKATELGSISMLYAREDDPVFIATSSEQQYPQIFDWLQLIDTNVLAILVLMTLVAGFNMISGLLILLFRHIGTIGILKASGMTDRAISKVFLRVSSRAILTGMAVGNALALLFCLIQGTTHLLKLNPANYFIPFVPVSVNVPAILAADMAAWAAIMLLLTIPCLYISGIDPADTVRVK